MEALEISVGNFEKGGMKVSDFFKYDFTIGKWTFSWKNEKKLYVSSSEILGQDVECLVRNATQLVFKLATCPNGNGQCTVCIGEDGDEVNIAINWFIHDSPKLIGCEEKQELRADDK